MSVLYEDSHIDPRHYTSMASWSKVAAVKNSSAVVERIFNDEELKITEQVLRGGYSASHTRFARDSRSINEERKIRFEGKNITSRK